MSSAIRLAGVDMTPTHPATDQWTQPCCSFDALTSIIPDRALIYALADPLAPFRVRYVGKASGSLRKRWRVHMSHRDRWKTPKNDWINHLLSEGRKPIAWVLEICPADNWEDTEREWIAFYRKQGGLLNVTDGGDCGPVRRGWKHTPEALAKISAASREAHADGRIKCYFQGGWIKGVHDTPEAAANRKRACKNNHPPPWAALKAAAVNRGKHRSLETRSRIKAALVNKSNFVLPVVCVETGQMYQNHLKAAEAIGCCRYGVDGAMRRGLKIYNHTFIYA